MVSHKIVVLDVIGIAFMLQTILQKFFIKIEGTGNEL
jgi:hypothetical protein